MPYGEGQLEDEADPSFIPDEEEICKQWRRLAARLNYFKEQFAEEYLLYLRTRHQIDHHADPVAVPTIGKGDLVLMRNDTEKRCLWELAICQEILPSSDGKTRAVKLRTKNGECTRPIIKLHPLLSSKELRPNEDNTQDNEPREEEQPAQDETRQVDDGEAEVTITPATSRPPSPPPLRAQRAAKKAARNWLKGVTRDILDD